MAIRNYTYNIDCSKTCGDCQTVTNASCVAYNGELLPFLDINPGDDLEQILLMLDNIVESLQTQAIPTVNIANIGLGAEVYAGELGGIFRFRTFTTDGSIRIIEGASEIQFGVSSTWLSNFITSVGFPDAAALRAELDILEDRVDDIDGGVSSIDTLTQTVSEVSGDLSAIAGEIAGLEGINANQSQLIQQNKNNITALYGIEMTVVGGAIELRDGNGVLLSSVNLCNLINNCLPT